MFIVLAEWVEAKLWGVLWKYVCGGSRVEYVGDGGGSVSAFLVVRSLNLILGGGLGMGLVSVGWLLVDIHFHHEDLCGVFSFSSVFNSGIWNNIQTFRSSPEADSRTSDSFLSAAHLDIPKSVSTLPKQSKALVLWLLHSWHPTSSSQTLPTLLMGCCKSNGSI